MNLNEIKLLNGSRINMDFSKAYIYGNVGCGKGFVTKHKISELLSEGKRIYLCDVDNEYQFEESENLIRITRKLGDSYKVWIQSIQAFLIDVESFCDDEDWFVIDDINNLDSIKDILETVKEKNLNLIIVSQKEPNNIVKEFFVDSEIFNLSYTAY